MKMPAEQQRGLTQQSVISMAMERDSMLADDMTEGEHRYNKDDWTIESVLQDTTGDRRGSGHSTTHANKLFHPKEIECNPVQGSTR